MHKYIVNGADMADLDRKFEQLETRIRGSETALATLTANITVNTNNLKENLTRTQGDLGGRIDSLKSDMKENNAILTQSINTLNDSLHKLYVSHSGSQNTVKFNEKIVWGIVTVILTAGLYLLQGFIKGAGS